MSPHCATEEKEIHGISITTIGKKTDKTYHCHAILLQEVTGGIRVAVSTPQPLAVPVYHPAQSSATQLCSERKRCPQVKQEITIEMQTRWWN